jgi:3-methyl-2-oxobutanoate hydroxymethyltransferase
VTITRAVRRGAPHAFIMADMPFGSYPDVPTATTNAVRFMRESGADAVKLECDARHEAIVRALAAAGVVVCAHLGLLPQRAQQFGGFRAQGRTIDEAQRITEDAVLLYRAGAALLLLEAVPDEVSRQVRAQTACPLIGCGAGPSCDGHVVVLHDMLGYTARPPRFVEPLADIAGQVRQAAGRYRDDVEQQRYPADRHQYRMKG